MSRGKNSELRIPIVGKTVRLVFQGLENIGAFEAHFPPAVSCDGDDLDVRVLTRDDQPAPDMEAPIQLDGHGEYIGGLDLACRKGWVRLTGQWPAEGLANFLRQAALRLALRQGGAVVHGACIVRRDEAFIFYGPSGAGKTTVCTLSDGFEVANDDLTAILKSGERLEAWGMPRAKRFPALSGRTGPFRIRAVFKLVQDTQTFLEPLPAALALAQLAALPKQFSDGQAEQALHVLSDMVKTVPCYALHFTKSRDFWACIETELDK